MDNAEIWDMMTNYQTPEDFIRTAIIKYVGEMKTTMLPDSDNNEIIEGMFQYLIESIIEEFE